ncbi:MAG: DUF6580 family putative transport protein [Bdellovibrionota bacterium]
MTQSKLIFLVGLMCVGILSRWIPHPMNFTAVGAIALLIGSTYRMRWVSLVLPMLILFLSDLVLGLHSTMIYVYSAFLISILMGQLIPKQNYFQKSQAVKILGLSLSSSLIFFVITNFGVWISGGLYLKTFQGLVTCFVMAIPFLKNQVLGDLFFSGILFSAYELLSRRVEIGSKITTSV